MSDPQQSGMSPEFRARMRQGLSTMAVRERVRERRRNRAIAGGAVAAVAAAVVGVGVWQFAGALDPRIDEAAPAPTTTMEPSADPTEEPSTEPSPAPTPIATPEPSSTGPTPPPGFEGVAAGEPIVTAAVSVGDSGDTGAGGGAALERLFDVYVLCEGSGTVSFGGEVWIDCADFEAGTGWAVFNEADVVGDGDPRYTASGDFDGHLQVVDAGTIPLGAVSDATATVYYDCGPSVTIGGTFFDCFVDPGMKLDLAAWGVPIAPGSFAPDMGSDSAQSTFRTPVRWVMER